MNLGRASVIPAILVVGSLVPVTPLSVAAAPGTCREIPVTVGGATAGDDTIWALPEMT